MLTYTVTSEICNDVLKTPSLRSGSSLRGLYLATDLVHPHRIHDLKVQGSDMQEAWQDLAPIAMRSNSDLTSLFLQTIKDMCIYSIAVIFETFSYHSQ